MNNTTKGVRLSDEQRLDWLRLFRSQNVGPRTFRALINYYGGARAALDALPSLARRGGSGAAPKIYSREQAEREVAIAHKLGATFVGIGETEYPLRLQMIDDAPPLIAIRGNHAALAIPTVAIVGSRNASAPRAASYSRRSTCSARYRDRPAAHACWRSSAAGRRSIPR